MAHAIYERMWHDAMGELRDMLKVEDPTVGLEAGAPTPVVSYNAVFAFKPHRAHPKRLQLSDMNPQQAYQHARIMYLKYCGVYSKLERCYRGLTHPQKREDVAIVIEAVLTRMAIVQAVAVKYAPFNPEVATAQKGKPFVPVPWPYVAWDDLLTEMKAQPDVLDVPIPAQIKEEKADLISKRDAIIAEQCRLRLGVDMVAVEFRSVLSPDFATPGAVPGEPGSIPVLTMDEAIAVIVRNERGRQGKLRAAQMKRKHDELAIAVALAASDPEGGNAFLANPRPASSASRINAAMQSKRGEKKSEEDKQKKSHAFDDDDEDDGEEAEPVMDAGEAAMMIQRMIRSFLAVRRTVHMRSEEGTFLGAKANKEDTKQSLDREKMLSTTLSRRQLDQAAYRRGLVTSLPDLQTLVLTEEGSIIREKLKAEREAWLRMHMLKNNNMAPEEIEDFYAWKTEQAAAAASGAGAKDAGKGKGEPVAEADKPPKMVGPSDWSKSVFALLARYEDVWVGRNESGNPEQRHDIELAKGLVRPAVSEHCRSEVDKLVGDEIENLKAAGPKRKAPKKKKAPKAPKPKKEKPLPGAKLCPGMDIEAMLAALVEFRMVNTPSPEATFDAFYGEHNMLLSKYNITDTAAQRHPTTNAWVPSDPSMAQVREVLLTHAVLPLGSPTLRRAYHEFREANKMGKSRYPRAFLLYGPPGSGKTHLVQAVANATGACLLNVSSGVTEGKCMEKGGQAKLLHLAFEVAKSPTFTGSSVIYIDQIEKMFPGAVKGAKGKAAKPDPNGPARFKKDILTYINSLNPDHSAIVIATTSEPWAVDLKSAMDAFDTFLYVPPLDHGGRLRSWRREVACAISEWEANKSRLAHEAACKVVQDAADAAIAEAAMAGKPKDEYPVCPPMPAAPAPGPLSQALRPILAGFNALPLSHTAIAAPTAALPSHDWCDSFNYSALGQVTAGMTAGSIRSAVRMTLTFRRLDRWEAGTRVTEPEFVAALSSLPRMFGEEADMYREFTDAVTGLAAARTVADANAAPAKKK